jgi:ribose-phosphate pyrophosphokinase
MILYQTDQSWYAEFVFPDGAQQVQLTDPPKFAGLEMTLVVDHSSTSCMFRSMLLVDALVGAGAYVSAFIPYIYGGRQDRQQNGTPDTASIIMDYFMDACDYVGVFDPHSLNWLHNWNKNVVVYSAHEVLAKAEVWMPKFDWVITPDHGAVGRAEAFAEFLGIKKVSYGIKKRNFDTGSITGYESLAIPEGVTNGLVVDDICDGGATFHGLADIVGGRVPLSLWVSHGIFSKGTSELLKRYTHILTTDSYAHPNVNVTRTYSIANLIERFHREHTSNLAN